MMVTTTDPVEVKVHDRVEVPVPPVTVVGDSVHAELSLVRATSLVNPFREATAIVEVPAFPTTTLTLDGLAVIVKSGWAVGLTSTFTVTL